MDDVSNWVEGSAFSRKLGVEAGDVSGESAELFLPFREENSNPGGALHGAPLGELHGASGVAAQLERSLLAAGAEFVVDEVNGQPGVVASVGGAVVAVIFFEVAADRVTTLRGVGNPAKLAHLNTR